MSSSVPVQGYTTSQSHHGAQSVQSPGHWVPAVQLEGVIVSMSFLQVQIYNDRNLPGPGLCSVFPNCIGLLCAPPLPAVSGTISTGTGTAYKNIHRIK